MLRVLFVTPIVLVLAAALCSAQDKLSGGQGYIFAAPGASLGDGPSEGSLHLGGGGEVFVSRKFAVGGEIGYAAPFSSFRDGLGVVSGNAAYHFGREKDRKLVPFLTGGYSLLFRDGTANAVNFGGGFNYWFKQRHGLRIEVRDHVRLTGETSHLLGVRIAWAFR